MHPVRTRCPNCSRNVAVPPGAIALLPAGFDPATLHYAFVCPACEEPCLKGATTLTAELLTRAGVSAVARCELSPRPHPEAPPSGPAFTLDDVIDFHTLLARDAWFQQLAR